LNVCASGPAKRGKKKRGKGKKNLLWWWSAREKEGKDEPSSLARKERKKKKRGGKKRGGKGGESVAFVCLRHRVGKNGDGARKDKRGKEAVLPVASLTAYVSIRGGERSFLGTALHRAIEEKRENGRVVAQSAISSLSYPREREGGEGSQGVKFSGHPARLGGRETGRGKEKKKKEKKERNLNALIASRQWASIGGIAGGKKRKVQKG